MARYAVAGRSAATAATADNFGAALWNPHASRSLYVVEIHWFKTVATRDDVEIARITARGTATVTVTPDVDNDYARIVAPVTGALLDTTYSAQPTIAGPAMYRNVLPAAIGAGFIYAFGGPGIEIPFGTGLGIGTPVATILQPADVTFIFDD